MRSSTGVYSYRRNPSLRVVSNRVQLSKLVYVCVEANSSCALVYSLGIRGARHVSYYGVGNGKKYTKAV